MKMTMHTTSNKLEYGKIYTAYVLFKPNLTEGKRRPVIVFQNLGNDNITAFQVTSQINKKYGYRIIDWENTGLKKPSVVKLHPEDILELKPSDLKQIVGELTERDKVGLLERYIDISKQIQKQQKALRTRKGMELDI